MNISKVTTPAPASLTGTRPPDPGRTPLQQHVDFFDRDGDRLTTVSETYAGLRSLGMGRLASAGSALVINLGLGLKTGAPWHSPLTVQNDNIHQGKHDSDSDVFDAQGNLDASKFEQMFAEFDRDRNDALDGAEIDVMLNTRRESFLGRQAAGAEFGLLLRLGGEDVDGQRSLTRERLQSFYDGSLFYKLAGQDPPASA